MAKDADKVTQNFEKQLDALEEIVNRMEQGDLTLEDSIKEFEQGMKLANQCQKTLSEAELRVKVLMENAMEGLADFDPESENNSAAD